MAKAPWNKPNPKKSKGSIKTKPGYAAAKKAADTKFGKKTSLVKNMWISKKLKD